METMTKKPGRPKKMDSDRKRDGVNLNVWLEPGIAKRFEESCKAARRTKTAHLEYILEKFFALTQECQDSDR